MMYNLLVNFANNLDNMKFNEQFYAEVLTIKLEKTNEIHRIQQRV